MEKGTTFKVGNHKGTKYMDEFKKPSTSDRQQNNKAIRDRWPFPDKPLNNIESIKTKFCGECCYLNVTEEEQTKKKEPHFCKKYKTQVKHDGYHPGIKALEVCRLDNSYGRTKGKLTFNNAVVGLVPRNSFMSQLIKIKK